MKPLSPDLRQRIIAALDTGASRQSVADRFVVSLSSVKRLATKKRLGLSLQPKPTPGRKRRVPEDELPAFEELVRSSKDWTAEVLADAWQAKGEATLSISTATRMLKHIHFSFKKNAKPPWSATHKNEPTSGSK
jgi:transposase